MSGDLDGGHVVDDRFQRLIENSAIATTLMDPDGRFVYANRAMCVMLGYDAETLSTMTWREVTAPDQRLSTLEVIEDITAGRRDADRIDWQYIKANGKRVWGQLTLSCMRGPDGPVDRIPSPGRLFRPVKGLFTPRSSRSPRRWPSGRARRCCS